MQKKSTNKIIRLIAKLFKTRNGLFINSSQVSNSLFRHSRKQEISSKTHTHNQWLAVNMF